MPQIFPGRYAATLEGDFVVFLIGMRINRLRRPDKWLPVGLAMGRMIPELLRQPELGLLRADSWFTWRTVLMVQYWRSFDQLHAYAHAKDKQHLPAWAAFNRAVGGNGTVGIFHETYMVRAGEYESIFANMPRIGMAAAGHMQPAIGRLNSARERAGR